MKSIKQTGSYYTPKYLTKFIFEYISLFLSCEILDIFEPSLGDGRFLSTFNDIKFSSNIKKISFTGIELIQEELNKAKNLLELKKNDSTVYLLIQADFLEYQKNISKKFNLIIGNPPYIKKNILTKNQIDTSKIIHSSIGLANFHNIWSSFLIRCVQLLDDNGILALVLPAEILQVKYARDIRAYLISQFNRIEIFTFNDLLFDGIGQDTIILICYKKHIENGLYYTRIKDINELQRNSFILKKNNILGATDAKWIHHFLSQNDLIFLDGLKKRLNNIDHYCDSKPGIVTAANDYFIIDEQKELEYELNPFTRSIIKKGLFVNGSIVIDSKNINEIRNNGEATKLLVFSDNDIIKGKVRDYLKYGEELQIKKRFKCASRKNWYVIPNIQSPAEGFFFKRSHKYPKIIKNEAKVLATDSAYVINMKEDYHINSLIYSFYNTITLCFAELNGRYYGGGVLELTPSEFKGLPIPYTAISQKQFDKFRYKFEKKESIDSILAENDLILLKKKMQLNDKEIDKIIYIYNKLLKKRFRQL